MVQVSASDRGRIFQAASSSQLHRQGLQCIRDALANDRFLTLEEAQRRFNLLDSEQGRGRPSPGRCKEYGGPSLPTPALGQPLGSRSASSILITPHSPRWHCKPKKGKSWTSPEMLKRGSFQLIKTHFQSSWCRDAYRRTLTKTVIRGRSTGSVAGSGSLRSSVAQRRPGSSFFTDAQTDSSGTLCDWNGGTPPNPQPS